MSQFKLTHPVFYAFITFVILQFFSIGFYDTTIFLPGVIDLSFVQEGLTVDLASSMYSGIFYVFGQVKYIQYAAYFVFFMHTLDVIKTIKLCSEKGIGGVDRVLWVLQSFYCGKFSLGLLEAMDSKINKKNE